MITGFERTPVVHDAQPRQATVHVLSVPVTVGGLHQKKGTCSFLPINSVFYMQLSLLLLFNQKEPHLIFMFLRLDVLSSHALHPSRASEEGPLLHGPADDAAHHSVCIRNVSSALHEDGLSASDDSARPCEVRLPEANTGREESIEFTT